MNMEGELEKPKYPNMCNQASQNDSRGSTGDRGTHVPLDERSSHDAGERKYLWRTDRLEELAKGGSRGVLCTALRMPWSESELGDPVTGDT
ncbi:hypothetical protein CERSUDRAFT_118354 [Gelatoporia subvermispora B]|uniref:Uncharacterized protein n=1 Tax=Ceriporiopsis subvermispora (strain B) TaxID=914234 RepID=M2R230_CERS8|nr:hypothetical protein CERSUDRAFT_118354 [Gelatoporia subvermispora B]